MIQVCEPPRVRPVRRFSAEEFCFLLRGEAGSLYRPRSEVLRMLTVGEVCGVCDAAGAPAGAVLLQPLNADTALAAALRAWAGWRGVEGGQFLTPPVLHQPDAAEPLLRAAFARAERLARGGRVLEGTFQLCNASVHVNGQYGDTKRTFDSCEVVLDEDVKSAEETRTLGVEVGDVVCFEPRTRLTASGYIKSRFLDDKLSVGILLGLAKYLKDTGTVPQRHVYLHVTVYEEVGHGGAANVPQGVTEAISVDMGCVGEGLQCTERQVSICAKDSGGPYSYEVVGKLIDAARRTGADYAVDVYPHYGSDVEATLSAGHDLRHGLIGAGVYASHGYERSHVDGVWNTLKVLAGYLEADGVR